VALSRKPPDHLATEMRASSDGRRPRRQSRRTHANLEKARAYMKERAEPVVAKLVQQLAKSQPDDILGFIADFAARERRELAAEEREVRRSGQQLGDSVSECGLEAEARASTEVFGSSGRRNQLSARSSESSRTPSARRDDCAGDAEQADGINRTPLSDSPGQSSPAHERSDDGGDCAGHEAAGDEQRAEATIQDLTPERDSSPREGDNDDSLDEAESPKLSPGDSEDQDGAISDGDETKAGDAATSQTVHDMEHTQDEELGVAGSGDLAVEATKVCCVSGTSADVKVRLPGSSEIEYYASDIYEALKRKNKLRGAVAVAIDQALPSPVEPATDEPVFPLNDEERERLAKVPRPEDVDNRPVTPPKRGFEMTLPGQNYHPGGGPRIVGPVGPVKFTPRALGENNAEDCKAAALEAAAKRAKETEDNLTDEQRENMRMRRKKDELIGKIHAHYSNMGGAAPVGLGACSVETLQRHLRQVKRHLDESRAERVETQSRVETDDKLRKVVGKLSGLGGAGPSGLPSAAPARTLSFEPRALGSTQSAPSGDDRPAQAAAADSAAARRERAAMAAARRLGAL